MSYTPYTGLAIDQYFHTHGLGAAMYHLSKALQSLEIAEVEGIPLKSIADMNITHDDQGNIVIAVDVLQEQIQIGTMYLRDNAGTLEMSADGSTWQAIGADVTPEDIGAARQIELDAHTGDNTNPHAVTAAQVGAATQADFSSHANGSSYWDHQKLATYISGTLHQPNKYTLVNNALARLAIMKAVGMSRLTGICHLVDGFVDDAGVTGGNYTHDAINNVLDIPGGGQVVNLAPISMVGSGQHGVRIYVLAAQSSFGVNINGSNYAEQETIQTEDGTYLKIWKTGWLNTSTLSFDLLTFGSAVTYQGIYVDPLLAREV